MPSDFDTAADLLRHGYRADFDAQLDAARQEGRDEVLRELAAVKVHCYERVGIIDEHGLCPFCQEATIVFADHAPLCIWRRALAASQTP